MRLVPIPGMPCDSTLEPEQFTAPPVVQGPVPSEQYEDEEDTAYDVPGCNDVEGMISDMEKVVASHKTRVLPETPKGRLDKYLETPFDSVAYPGHYQLFPEHEIQAIDVIERLLVVNELTGFEAYCFGNAVKYLLRAGKKGDFYEDIGKAKKYLSFIVG